MSMLYRERRVLSSCWQETEEALEFLDAVISQHQQGLLDTTRDIYNHGNEQGNDPVEIVGAIDTLLRSIPSWTDVSQDTTAHLANLLYSMHLAGDALRAVRENAELAIEHYRHDTDAVVTQEIALIEHDTVQVS